MAPKNLPPVKPVAAAVFAATKPGGLEPYVHGDAIPIPDAVEKNTDSVWALWSDAVKEEPEVEKSDKAGKEDKDGHTDAMATTILMELDELPKDPDA